MSGKQWSRDGWLYDMYRRGSATGRFGNEATAPTTPSAVASPMELHRELYKQCIDDHAGQSVDDTATLASLVCPTRAEDMSRTKDPMPVASWDELLIFVMMIALITVGVWELVKYVSKTLWKRIKMAKKAKKIQRFGDFATEVARQEIRSQEAMRSRRFPNAAVEAVERTPTTPVEQEQQQELSTPTLRQRSSMMSLTPSPTQSSSSFSATRTFNEDPVERQRVAVDMLSLMTVEELKVGLRCEGCPVSGNKADLARRLAECLKSSREGDERDLPTTKQMKYVLWLYRTRSLSGRCKLVWADLNTKSRISGWIALWKSA